MSEDRENIAEQAEVFEKAVRRKWSKYTLSGLLLIGLGLILILVGVLLNTGTYSSEGLLIGFGAIIVIAGIIRILIGVINPSTPEELRAFSTPVAPSEASEESGL